MAAGIGMEVGQQEANLAAQATSEMAQALINLLRALSRNGSEQYTDDFDRGMKVIARHVEKGGSLRQSFMDVQDENLFADTLKESHVPFMRFGIKTADGERAVFLTRGGTAHDGRILPDDGAQLEKAWAAFTRKMMERMQEMKEKSVKVQKSEVQEKEAVRSKRRRDGCEIDHM